MTLCYVTFSVLIYYIESDFELILCPMPLIFSLRQTAPLGGGSWRLQIPHFLPNSDFKKQMFYIKQCYWLPSPHLLPNPHYLFGGAVPVRYHHPDRFAFIFRYFSRISFGDTILDSCQCLYIKYLVVLGLSTYKRVNFVLHIIKVD